MSSVTDRLSGRSRSQRRDDSASLESAKAAVHARLLETLNFNRAQQMPFDRLYEECSRRVDRLLDEQKCSLSAPEKKQFLQEILDEIFGLGPIEDLMRDPTISDILVNGPKQIYIERDGRLEPSDVTFRDEAQLLQVIDRIAVRTGRRIDESSPMLDARTPDGSRVNAIIPPLALDGPALSIRRFGAKPIETSTLIELGSLAEDVALFLQTCVTCKMNLLISGGTGAGKTTLLNALSKHIPAGERVVTIEDAAELQLQREHVVRLETRPPNIEGSGEVTQRDLLRNSLRMRPDRIIIGEVRGAETVDMLQAMNTGHEGSMTTVHANSPRDALSRVENMVSMAGLTYPVHAIRQQMSSALDLLVQVERVAGGRRKVVSVVEVAGMEDQAVSLQELFRYVQVGVDDDGHAAGRFEACGVRPRLLGRLRARGASLRDDLFGPRELS